MLAGDCRWVHSRLPGERSSTCISCYMSMGCRHAMIARLSLLGGYGPAHLPRLPYDARNWTKDSGTIKIIRCRTRLVSVAARSGLVALLGGSDGVDVDPDPERRRLYSRSSLVVSIKELEAESENSSLANLIYVDRVCRIYIILDWLFQIQYNFTLEWDRLWGRRV